MPRRWRVSETFCALDLCREWGITYQQYLAQPPEHRALMMTYLGIKSRMEAVEAQERREREALRRR